MRGDLVKVDGISDIKTDIPNRLCTFRLAGKGEDIQDELTKLAQTNDHMAGFEVVHGVN